MTTPILDRLTKRKRRCEGRGDDAIALPLSMFIPYVEQYYPTLKSKTMHVEEIHKAFIHILKHKRMCVEQAEVKRPYDCSECRNGYIVIDQSEGIHVCDTCGYIHALIQDAFSFESLERIDHGSANRRCLASVEKKIIRAIAFVEGWGVYLNVTGANLDEAKRHCEEHAHAIRSVEALAFASLLVVHFHMPCQSTLQKTMRMSMQLPTLADPRPRPSFSCNACGAMCFSHKCARYHCKKLKG